MFKKIKSAETLTDFIVGKVWKMKTKTKKNVLS